MSRLELRDPGCMYQFTGFRDPVRLAPALKPAMTPEIWCKPLKGLTGAAGNIFTLRMGFRDSYLQAESMLNFLSGCGGCSHKT